MLLSYSLLWLNSNGRSTNFEMLIMDGEADIVRIWAVVARLNYYLLIKATWGISEISLVGQFIS